MLTRQQRALLVAGSAALLALVVIGVGLLQRRGAYLAAAPVPTPRATSAPPAATPGLALGSSPAPTAGTALSTPPAATTPVASPVPALAPAASPTGGEAKVYAPVLMATAGPPGAGEWPQFAHDAQRTGATSLQVAPPYCYSWKWLEVPLASRAQPVVAGGRLFVGALDGALYARDASSGAPLWRFATGGPIRHAPAVAGASVIVSSYDGFTYALEAATGRLLWQAPSGPSAAAPLVANNTAYIAASSGTLSAYDLATGSLRWQYAAGAPLLTTPALSADGQTLYLGSEAVEALAVRASDGSLVWRQRLQGQSLADRSPVVAGSRVLYRTQPLYFFHELLHEGDTVMDQAGPRLSDPAADWALVRPQIVSYLSQQPAKQTFFVLDAATGSPQGVAPVLYTYGNNDIPNQPVVTAAGQVYVTYRARHGIQTDGGAVHVTSEYDAELGRLELASLDIQGLRQAAGQPYANQFRMTSDEPAMLSVGGSLLYVDNWERLGALDLATGQLVHVGAVSNDWPECYAQCGPGSPNPFFPLSGNPADPAYPFPGPRVTEGHQRGGLVIANNMLYWRVAEAGLAGLSHQTGASCPAPRVWTAAEVAPPAPAAPPPSGRSLSDYLTLDLTRPPANPPADLVGRVRQEVAAMLASGQHLMPFYLERGFTQQMLWPYNTANPPGLPKAGHGSYGNVYWHDPGELLYTAALVYPYLDSALQTQLKAYLAAEWGRYPPLQNLPWGANSWLKQGTARERYPLPFRAELSNWPPPAANLSVLYALWLWGQNTGDWSYAQAHYSEARALFQSRQGSLRYYADLGGAIGFYRLAQHFGQTADAQAASQVAVSAMQAGQDMTSHIQAAESDYLDPRDEASGWYAPVFYGLTPEVGRYLAEQTAGQAQRYLSGKETGNGLRWWWLTRAGAHAEWGETSYVAPPAAWSHFLAHAWVQGESQASLRRYLDRPWGVGDLYSLQKLAATLQAP